MNEGFVKLFCLNNAAIQADLETAVRACGLSSEQTEIEKSADQLIASYLPQFDYEIRLQAERMAEFYRIFYMLENDIRSLIVSTLEEYGADWWQEKVPENVRQNAEKNQVKALAQGIIPRSNRLIDYTTFGELSEIIKANWDIFGGMFSRHDKIGVERVMQQLNMLRAPIAHCGVLGEEEVVNLKLTVRRWFKIME